MFNRKQIMRRAWSMFRDATYGYLDFGSALSDAWAEAKGELTILDPHCPVVTRRPLGIAAWSARESVKSGKRKLRDMASYATGGH